MVDEEVKLVHLLKKGDPSAYRQLFDKHYILLCKVAYEFLRDHFAAEAIVSDIIASLWENRKKIDIKISVRNYLIGAVRYSCRDYLQKKYVKKEVNFSKFGGNNYLLDYPIRSDAYPLGVLLEKELEYNIMQAVDRLPKESREVFKLSRFEEMSYEQIAEKLSISVNTVKYHIKNAIAKLKEDLDKYLTIFLLLISGLRF